MNEPQYSSQAESRSCLKRMTLNLLDAPLLEQASRPLIGEPEGEDLLLVAAIVFGILPILHLLVL